MFDKENNTFNEVEEQVEQSLSAENIEQLRMEQKLKRGIVAGLVVGIVGAILWGIITVIAEYQIGYMAIAVGAGVGFAVRKLGKGIDQVFGFWGAGISLFSVLLGNFLSIIGFIANAEGLGYIETLFMFDYSYLPQVMKESFSAMDLLFYAIAMYEGYQFSFRKITRSDKNQRFKNESIF
jgi:F0F1-type ATP synthase assembly protein I